MRNKALEEKISLRGDLNGVIRRYNHEFETALSKRMEELCVQGVEEKSEVLVSGQVLSSTEAVVSTATLPSVSTMQQRHHKELVSPSGIELDQLGQFEVPRQNI